MPLDDNQLQGRFILAQGWLSKDLLKRAVARVRADRDLCEVLLTHKALTPEQVRACRAGVEKHKARSHRRGSSAERPGARAARNHKRPTGRPAVGEATRIDDEPAEARPLAGLPPIRPAAPPPLAQPSRNHEAIREAAADSARFAQDLLRPGVSDMTGRRFRNYEIISELNRGAMGVVYRARDVDEDVLVALKFMLAVHPNEDELTRFKREIGVLARLEHPHIVRVHDFGAEHGVLFFAMELIEGINLQQLVEETFKAHQRAPAWDRIARILEPIARALEYCHESGIFHRDVKPQNILVEAKTERAVLVDFGLIKKDRSKIGDSYMSAGQSLTQHGEIVGTPAFMAPEQFAPGGRFGDLGPKVDVWGFGATLFFAMSNKSPFHQKTAIEIFREIMSRDAPPLERYNPELPEWLLELTAATLTRSSFMRPSMSEVRRALEEKIAPERREPRAAAPSSRRWLGAVVAGTLSFAALVLGAWFVLQNSEPENGFQFVRAESPFVNGEVATIVGSLRSPGRVRLGGQVYETNAAGDFRVDIRTSAPTQSLSVELLDSKGAILERSRAIEVIRDLKPPALKLHGFSQWGLIFLTDGHALEGAVWDDHKAGFVKVNGHETVETGDQGEFTILLPDTSDIQELLVVAEDAAGNQTSETVRVLTPLAVAKFNTGVGWARTFETWKVCRTEDLEFVAYIISMALGEEVELLQVERFSDGMNVARFRHLPTGAELILVPGGRGTVGTALENDSPKSRSDARQRIQVLESELEANARQLEGLEVVDQLLEMRAELSGDPAVEARAKVIVRWLERFPGLRPNIFDEIDASDAPKLSGELEGWLIENHDVVTESSRRIDESVAEQLDERGLSVEALPTLREAQAAKAAELEALQRLRRTWEESPPKPIRVEPFLIGRAELTRGEWNRVAPSALAVRGSLEMPMTSVSWTQVQAWLEAAGGGLRLPTDEEWEYACRAGADTAYPWGDAPDPDLCHCESTAPRPANPAASQNKLLLLDACGNVEEWTSTEGSDLREEPALGTRVVKGGSFASPAFDCRSASRRRENEEHRDPKIGFRVVLPLDNVKMVGEDKGRGRR